MKSYGSQAPNKLFIHLPWQKDIMQNFRSLHCICGFASYSAVRRSNYLIMCIIKFIASNQRRNQRHLLQWVIEIQANWYFLLLFKVNIKLQMDHFQRKLLEHIYMFLFADLDILQEWDLKNVQNFKNRELNSLVSTFHEWRLITKFYRGHYKTETWSGIGMGIRKTILYQQHNHKKPIVTLKKTRWTFIWRKFWQVQFHCETEAISRRIKNLCNHTICYLYSFYGSRGKPTKGYSLWRWCR